MKRQMILVMFLLITMGSVSGQKLTYSGSLEAAFLAGSAEPSFAFNVTQGVRFKQWNVSLGTGMDYYMFRSMPVFIDVKKSFNLWQMAPYIQASAGANFAQPRNSEKIVRYTWSSWIPMVDTTSTSGGLYARVNTGIIINPAAKIKWGVFAGWCNKVIKSTYEESVFNGSSYVKETHVTKYSLNRTSIGLVLVF